MKIVGGPASRKKQKLRPEDTIDILDVSLADTDLALRTQNTLEQNGVLKIRDLAAKTVEELMSIPNLGQITIQTLRTFLDKLGVKHRLNESNEVQIQAAKKRLDARNRKTAHLEPKQN